MTIEDMKKRKDELGYSCERIAELSGIPLGTVQKIFSGITKRPRYETLRALERVLDEKSCETFYQPELSADMVRESSPVYRLGKKQGEYTIEDYYTFPEEQRVELIDGVIYDLAAPSYVHQLIGGEMYACIRAYIRKKHGACIVSQAPVDVQLDCDDKTMIQPDIMVVCDRDRIRKQGLAGAPDFVAEILSESTRKKDMGLKLQKYMYAGVREYWLVDPDKKKVMVYDLEHEDFPVIYGFDSSIPVGIWNGDCRIDFGEIYEYIKFLYK